MDETKIREENARYKEDVRKLKLDRAQTLRAAGFSNSEIGRVLDLYESSVRYLLNE